MSKTWVFAVTPSRGPWERDRAETRDRSAVSASSVATASTTSHYLDPSGGELYLVVNPPRAVAPPAAPAGTANVRAVTATSPQEGVSPVKIGFRPICRTTTRPTAAWSPRKGRVPTVAWQRPKREGGWPQRPCSPSNWPISRAGRAGVRHWDQSNSNERRRGKNPGRRSSVAPQSVPASEPSSTVVKVQRSAPSAPLGGPRWLTHRLVIRCRSAQGFPECPVHQAAHRRGTHGLRCAGGV